MTRDQWLQRLDERDNDLGALFMVYLGEDWLDDYGLPWTNVLDAFVADHDSAHARAALSELDQLLAELDEADLNWLLDDGVHLGLNWEAPSIGFASARAWLLALRDELRRRIRQEV